MTPSEIIFLVIGIAIVVLVIFLVRTLFIAGKTLKKVNHLIVSVQKQVDNLGHEPRNLLRNVNDISSDFNSKMKCLNPLFGAVEDVGEGLQFKTNSFKERFQQNRVKEERNVDGEDEPYKDLVDLVTLGVKFWSKYKKRS